MTLEEMYKKHQQMWLDIHQAQRTRSDLVTKRNAKLSNREEVRQQFAECFACEYAVREYSKINNISLDICKEDLECSDICPYCPLDFAVRCEEKYSLYRAFCTELDTYKRAKLALKIASTPLKDKISYK